MTISQANQQSAIISLFVCCLLFLLVPCSFGTFYSLNGQCLDTPSFLVCDALALLGLPSFSCPFGALGLLGVPLIEVICRITWEMGFVITLLHFSWCKGSM